MGAYAALELGPGALNLAGAKTGAALVAAALARGGTGKGRGGSSGGTRRSGGAAREGDGGRPDWLARLAALQVRYLLP
jgi:hypothetical protein